MRSEIRVVWKRVRIFGFYPLIDFQLTFCATSAKQQADEKATSIPETYVHTHTHASCMCGSVYILESNHLAGKIEETEQMLAIKQKEQRKYVDRKYSERAVLRTALIIKFH